MTAEERTALEAAVANAYPKNRRALRRWLTTGQKLHYETRGKPFTDRLKAYYMPRFDELLHERIDVYRLLRKPR